MPGVVLFLLHTVLLCFASFCSAPASSVVLSLPVRDAFCCSVPVVYCYALLRFVMYVLFCLRVRDAFGCSVPAVRCYVLLWQVMLRA
eukprot:5089330-Pyramimonas_sp.AAC.1